MVLIVSFMFCALWVTAQSSLSDKLYNVLRVQNMDMGVKLYNEITDEEIKQLPDTSLRIIII